MQWGITTGILTTVPNVHPKKKCVKIVLLKIKVINEGEYQGRLPGGRRYSISMKKNVRVLSYVLKGENGEQKQLR